MSLPIPIQCKAQRVSCVFQFCIFHHKFYFAILYAKYHRKVTTYQSDIYSLTIWSLGTNLRKVRSCIWGDMYTNMKWVSPISYKRNNFTCIAPVCCSGVDCFRGCSIQCTENDLQKSFLKQATSFIKYTSLFKKSWYSSEHYFIPSDTGN